MLRKAKHVLKPDSVNYFCNNYHEDLMEFYTQVIKEQIPLDFIFIVVHGFDSFTLRKLQTMLEHPRNKDSIQAQRLLKMIETVPNYNPLMYDPDYIAQLESQLEVAIPAIFDLLQADYANFIQSKDLADYLYAYLSPLKTKDGNNITKSFIDCFLLKDLHDNILQLSAKEILLYAGLRILFLNLIGETWNEYSGTVNRKMNRNQNLLEYYKAARESMQCLFIKDIKRINKKIEKYNHKVDHDGKYMILPEMLPVILS